MTDEPTKRVAGTSEDFDNEDIDPADVGTVEDLPAEAEGVVEEADDESTDDGDPEASEG